MKAHPIDPIISEVRAVRDTHGARFGYDLSAIFRDIRTMQEKSGREYVRLPARRVAAPDALSSESHPRRLEALMRISELDGDSWTKRTARAGFPILVEYAQKHQEITYGEWDHEIVERELGSHVMAVQYGKPAGTIGNACEEYAANTGVPVPPINLLVVNKKKPRLPGTGADDYIQRFCSQFLDSDVDPKHLNSREKRALIDRAHEEIFAFPSWGDVLAACGLVETGPRRPKRKRRRPRPSRWNTGPESDEHKRLKQMIADDPALVDLQSNEKGGQEHPLWSGDRLDVYFEKAGTGVEVKTSDAGFDEIHRGVFQCVKYKAVMQAQQIHDRQIPTADCLLALGGVLPEGLKDIVALFNLRCYEKLAQTRGRRRRRRR